MSAPSSPSRRLWQTAGGLLIGSVVLTFAGAAFQANLTLGASASDASDALVESSMPKLMSGGYVELLSVIVFLFGALLLARLVRGSDDTSRWLASCGSGAALVYTAVTVATGLAAGGAALYDGHHGAPLATVTTVNDIRNIGFALSGGIAGAMVIALSLAGLASGVWRRWFGYVGVVVGVVLLAAVPAAKSGAPQTMLWFLWLVVTGVIALRRSPASAVDSRSPSWATA